MNVKAQQIRSIKAGHTPLYSVRPIGACPLQTLYQQGLQTCKIHSVLSRSEAALPYPSNCYRFLTFYQPLQCIV